LASPSWPWPPANRPRTPPRRRPTTPASPPSTASSTATRSSSTDVAAVSSASTRRAPLDCWATEASSALAQLAPPGSHLDVVAGDEPTDRYGRDLTYLWTDDGTFINAALVGDGHARPLPIAPNTRHARLLDTLADGARTAQTGLWRCS